MSKLIVRFAVVALISSVAVTSTAIPAQAGPRTCTTGMCNPR